MLSEVGWSLASFLVAILINSSLILTWPWPWPHLLSWPLLSKPAEILVLLGLGCKHWLNNLTAYCLGLVCLVGLQNISSQFGLYLAVLSTFHFSEFIVTGLGNPQNLSFDSYLVNHSTAYGLAMAASWLEHFTQLWLWPDLKLGLPVLSWAGLALCITGEIVRKTAMLHAGRNFNHLVQSTRDSEHRLVTSGIYSFCRHPSYAGWFLWSLGSQVILCNPVCLVIYAVVSFQFFNERIYAEEFSLLQFFGSEYREYQARVGTGIPGIQGFPVTQRVWGEHVE